MHRMHKYFRQNKKNTEHSDEYLRNYNKKCIPPPLLLLLPHNMYKMQSTSRSLITNKICHNDVLSKVTSMAKSKPKPILFTQRHKCDTRDKFQQEKNHSIKIK
jgi:hypothetical protein